MAESAVATATDGTVGEPVAAGANADYEAKYKQLQAEFTRKSQKLAEYEKQGAKQEPKQPSLRERTAELISKVADDDPATPVLKQLAEVVSEQENRLQNLSFVERKFYEKELDSRLTDARTKAASIGMKLDEQAIKATFVEKNLPLYDDDGTVAYDPFEIAKMIQPDEYERALKAKAVADYIAEKEGKARNAVPASSGKSASEPPTKPGDLSSVKDFLKELLPGHFVS